MGCGGMLVLFMSCVPRHHMQEAIVLANSQNQLRGNLGVGNCQCPLGSQFNELLVVTAAMLGNAGTGRPCTQNCDECSLTLTHNISGFCPG